MMMTMMMMMMIDDDDDENNNNNDINNVNADKNNQFYVHSYSYGVILHEKECRIFIKTRQEICAVLKHLYRNTCSTTYHRKRYRIIDVQNMKHMERCCTKMHQSPTMNYSNTISEWHRWQV